MIQSKSNSSKSDEEVFDESNSSQFISLITDTKKALHSSSDEFISPFSFTESTGSSSSADSREELFDDDVQQEVQRIPDSGGSLPDEHGHLGPIKEQQQYWTGDFVFVCCY